MNNADLTNEFLIHEKIFPNVYSNRNFNKKDLSYINNNLLLLHSRRALK